MRLLALLGTVVSSMLLPFAPVEAPTYIQVPKLGSPEFQLEQVGLTLVMCAQNQGAIYAGDKTWLERRLVYLTPEKQDWVRSMCAAYTIGALMPRDLYDGMETDDVR